MIYQITISTPAETDLRNIFTYIAFELNSPLTALQQLSRLEEQINSLDRMPKRFSLYQKEPWLSRGLRFVPVDNYIIFYIPQDSERTVTIIRVMYKGKDIENEL